MINTNTQQRATLLFFSILLISNAAVANTAFHNPDSAAWGGWSRGDSNTSFAHWSHIGGPGTLDVVDSTPDIGNNGTTSAVLAANNPGAFVTGSGAGGNIYSFSDTPDFTVIAQPNYSVLTDPVTVALQLKVLGTDLDSASVKLGGVAWDSSQTIFSGTAGGPFGGLDKEYLFVWNNVTADIAYQLDFLASGSSMSLDEVSVDIGVSAVPLPATAWLFLTALSGLVATSRNKPNIA